MSFQCLKKNSMQWNFNLEFSNEILKQFAIEKSIQVENENYCQLPYPIWNNKVIPGNLK